MKDKLNGEYRVKWRGDIDGVTKGESFYTYSLTGPLKHRFISTCEMIINHIKVMGHVATVEETDAGDGVLIIERQPNDLTIIAIHWVYIRKD